MKNRLQKANVLSFTGENEGHGRVLPRRPSQQQRYRKNNFTKYPNNILLLELNDVNLQ